MACSDYDTLREFWVNLQFFDGVNCYYVNTAGGADSVQFLVFVFLGLSLYAYQRKPLVPLVVALLFGGVFVAPLPAGVVNLATVIGVLMTAVVMFLLAWRVKSRSFA